MLISISYNKMLEKPANVPSPVHGIPIVIQKARMEQVVEGARLDYGNVEGLKAPRRIPLEAGIFSRAGNGTSPSFFFAQANPTRHLSFSHSSVGVPS